MFELIQSQSILIITCQANITEINCAYHNILAFLLGLPTVQQANIAVCVQTTCM